MRPRTARSISSSSRGRSPSARQREAGALIDSLKTYRDRPSGSGFEGAVRSIDAFLPVVRAVEAFLPVVRADSEQIRKNLADVLLAQGYQDLTGQIIRSVIKLVEELEEALASSHQALGRPGRARHARREPGQGPRTGRARRHQRRHRLRPDGRG